MFKNESTIVINKAQKRYEALSKPRNERKTSSRTNPVGDLASRKSSNSPLPSSSTSLKSHQTPASTRSGSLARSIAPPIENQALSFFAANNISPPTFACRGNCQWLFQMLNGPETDAAVQSSAYATSLATLAMVNQSPVIMKKAQEHYAKALSLTNRALGDSIEVLKDSTVVSVILLGVYETFVFENHSMGAWMQHLKGAEMLFTLRGKDQFKSVSARAIFLQFFSIIMKRSIELGTPIPDKLSGLYWYVTSLNDYTMHGTYRYFGTYTFGSPESRILSSDS